MTDMPFRERAAAIRAAKAQLRRIQAEIRAFGQQIATTLEVAQATDWEDRYIAEGVQAIEAAANGEEER